MNLSDAARLFLMRQAQQDKTPQPPQPSQPPARVQGPPIARVRPPVIVQPVPPVSGDRRRYDPYLQSMHVPFGAHTSNYGHGDEQWPRCVESVHQAGMVRCGFRPLNLLAVDTSKPADVGLAYLDLGPFVTRYLSRIG